MSLVSTAQIAMPDAEAAFARLAAHTREHDLVVEASGQNDLTIAIGDSSIRFFAGRSALTLKVTAVTAGILYFLKESAVQHLAELYPQAAGGLRWQDADTPVKTDLPSSFQELQVSGKSEPMPGMIRLRLAGVSDGTNLEGPGIHVKLMLPVRAGTGPVWPRVADNGTTIWPSGQDALHVRYYTIRSCDPAAGEIEIDLVRHQGGFFAEWAETAQRGDRIGLLGPAGGEIPKRGDRILLAGDMTALPALARMIENLPDGVTGDLVGEAETLADLQKYLPPTNLKLHALPPQCFQEEIVGFCRETAEQTIQFAWFAGEYRNAQTMRIFFKSELGLKKGKQYAITYWRAGSALKAD